MSKKILIFALLFISILSVGVFAHGALAQSASPVVLTADLHLGSNGTDVANLQAFLVAKGFLAMPQGVPMGYFGALTQAAVAAFQRAYNISPIAGYVGPITRARLATISYDSTPPTPGCCDTGNISLSALSPASGPVGSQVKVYGSGFALSGNRVNFGGGVVLNVGSSDSVSLTFTVPTSLTPACYYSTPSCSIATRQTALGKYSVSVSNDKGNSNSLDFTVTTGASVNPQDCLVQNSNSEQVQYDCPQISSINPNAGPIGTQVNIFGSGFTPSNNIVKIDGFNAATVDCSGCNMASAGALADHLSLTIPAWVVADGACANTKPNISVSCDTQPIQLTPGTHVVSVTNAHGTSNNVNFQVTSGVAGGAPIITSVTGPTTLGLNQIGTWTVNAVAPSSDPIQKIGFIYSANFGDKYCLDFVGNPCYTDPFQTSPTFTHTYAQAGTYTQTYTAKNGAGLTTQSTYTVKVGVDGNKTLSINSLAPNSGSVGTVVTISGTGFTATGNKVKLGNYVVATVNLISTGAIANGPGAIQFTIPASLSNCADTASSYCTQVYNPVQNGVYPVTVVNSNGTSNALNFTVGVNNGCFSTSGSCTPHINTLSPASGPVGTSVTITGTGFGATQGSSHVRFGGQVASASGTGNSGLIADGVITSWHDTTITLLVPSALSGSPGTYPVTVIVTASGTSNPYTFTLTSGGSASVPNIATSPSPSSGPVGTSVTITGSNFGASQGAAILNFSRTQGDMVFEYHPVVSSWSNNQIRFTVPSSAPYVGSVEPGYYNISIYTGAAPYAYSNHVVFTVTSNQSGSPHITSINPTSGPIGSSVTINGTGLSISSNSINFGQGRLTAVAGDNYGTSMYFVVPSSVSPCGSNASGCEAPTYQVTPGASYPISVTSGDTTSNAATFTVTGAQATAPQITSLSPVSGAAGTSVTINGSGFLTSNTIRFGTSQMAINDHSGANTLTFTVPANSNWGATSVSVTNANGSSNAVNFNVNPSPFPAPTAHFTANSSNDITVNVGDAVSYSWSSTNGGVFRSSYTNSCAPGVTADWTINTNAGNSSGVIASSQAGCTYTITYTVVGAAGNATATVVVRVRGTGGITSTGGNQAANILQAISALIKNNGGASNLVGSVQSALLNLFSQLQATVSGH